MSGLSRFVRRVARTRFLSSRHGFLLFRSFARTMGVYQTLLTLVFVVLIAVLFNNFFTALQKFTLIVTAADEELVAILATFVDDGLVWLFALVCTYTICTIVLTVKGAHYLQERGHGRAAPAPHKQ